MPGVEDLVEGLHDGAGVHGEAAVHTGIEVVAARVALDVAIEGQAHQLAPLVHHGAAGVAADDVVGGDEVVGREEVQLVAARDPAGRQLPGAFLGGGAPGGGAVVEPGEGGEGLGEGAGQGVGLDGAIGEPQREGGIGVGGGAVDGEAGLGDAREVLGDHGLQGLLLLLEFVEPGGELAGQDQARVGVLEDGLGVTLHQRLAQGRIADPGAGEQRLGGGLGGLPAQQHLGHGMTGPELMLGRGHDALQYEGLLARSGGLDFQEAGLQGREGLFVLVLRRAQFRGLLQLGGVAVQGDGPAQGLAAHRAEEGGLGRARLLLGHGLLDLRPARPGRGLQLGIGLHLGAQGLLRLGHLGHGDLVPQAIGLPGHHLEGVLDPHQLIGDDAGLLFALGRVGAQRGAHALQAAERQGIGHVALGLHLGQGLEARGAARVPDREGQAAVGDALAGPGEVVGGRVGLPVLVDAEEAEVQVVPGPAEVVPVLAKGGHAVLRGHDEAHVGVLLVAVDPGLPALVERDGLAVEAGLGGLLLHQGGEGLGLGLGGRLLIGAGGHGLLDGLRHVLHLQQGEEGQPRHLELLVAGHGHEAVLDVVVLGGGDHLDPVVAHMMVGQHQAILADEGAGAAGKPHGGQPDVVQPGLVRRPAVLGLDLLGGQVVEGPHALVGAERGQGERRGKGDGQGGEAHRRLQT